MVVVARMARRCRRYTRSEVVGDLHSAAAARDSIKNASPAAAARERKLFRDGTAGAGFWSSFGSLP